MSALERAKAALGPADAPWIDPPVLLDVRAVFELVGEDLRGRLLLVGGMDGGELCLRPDMTLPTALDYARTAAPAPAVYRYEGRVFRAAEAGRIDQAESVALGVERFGEADRAAVDASLLADALHVLAEAGAPKTEVVLTDLGVFGAFLDALDLDEAWAERLGAVARRPATLARLLAAEGPALAEDDPARALIDLPPAEARRYALAMADNAAVGAMAGRTRQDVADRLLAKAALARSPRPPEEARRVLEALLAARGAPAQVLERRQAVAREAGLALDDYLQLAARRVDALLAACPPGAALSVDPGFEATFSYYDGFTFRARAPGGGPVLAAGGRYDGLLARLTAGAVSAPAAGFSIFPDALEAAR